MRRPTLATATLGAYIATIPTANWAVQHYGMVPVGLGQTAPAGVYLAGIALILRDAARETAGRRVTAAAILAGAALSYWLSTPTLALASAAAFGLSEALDMAVYEPLRKRGLITAMTASNAAGLAADSLLFLWLAFGTLDHLAGQLLGKAWMTVLAVAASAAWRRTRMVTA